MAKTTRLRYVSAKSLDEVMAFVSSLKFKIEIKGQPMKQGSRWFLFFVLPEDPRVELKSVDL